MTYCCINVLGKTRNSHTAKISTWLFYCWYLSNFRDLLSHYYCQFCLRVQVNSSNNWAFGKTLTFKLEKNQCCIKHLTRRHRYNYEITSRRSEVGRFQRVFSPSHTKFWCLMRSTHPVLPSNERRRAATCHGVRKECYSEVGEKTAICNSFTAPIYKDVLTKIQPEFAVATLSFEKLWFQTSVRHFHHIKRHVKETNH